MLANYHCNDRGSPDGERSMPGLQEAADWMRNMTISGEEHCAAIMRRVSLFLRRLKSLGPLEEGGRRGGGSKDGKKGERRERGGREEGESQERVWMKEEEKEIITCSTHSCTCTTHLPYLLKVFEWCSVL